MSQAELSQAIQRIDSRYRESVARSEAATLWTATYLLMGLRFDPEFARQLLKAVSEMRESKTYQAILDEGREEGWAEGRAVEARALLLRLGERQFGPPSEAVQSAIGKMTDVERLEQLAERVLDAAGWEELLAGV